MNQQLSSNPHCTILIVLLGITVGCSTVKLSDIPKKPLPSAPPILTELRLELPPEGGPRRPVDMSGVSAIPNEAPQIHIVEEDRTALRALAEQDPRVNTQLGERFAYIETEEVHPHQCQVTVEENSSPNSAHLEERPLNQVMALRMTYYSYSHNSAVYVCLQENHLSSVQRDPRKGYQPQEGTEEIEQAIRIARNDPRIAQDVQNLFGHAILTSPEEYRYFWVSDEAGFGNRVLWVTFSDMPESLALYFARVDLTKGQVLDAGKEPGPQ